MSPASRKKKDEEAAPTAAEVEAKASAEAGESVPKADDEPEIEETHAAEVEQAAVEAKASEEAAESQPAPKKPRAKKAAAEKAGEPEAEEKPKRGRKRAEPKADEAPKQDKPAKPARKRDQPRAQRAPGEAPVVVRAHARYVRTSARKARLVCDHIRGKDVEQARAILSFTPRGAAKPWLKLLESAIANAEHNHELVGDELKIHSIHADEGPTLKRYRPRAMGRATRIRKRTSHLTITLTPKE